MATIYRNYLIVLDDPVAATNLAAANPSGVDLSPDAAAIAYSAPIDETGTVPLAPPRIDLVGGHSASSILATSALSATWPADYTVDGDGILYPLTGNASGTIAWKGYFSFSAPVTTFPTPYPLIARRWIVGFESGCNIGLGGDSTSDRGYNWSASRMTGGKGFAYRRTTPGTVTMTYASLGITPDPNFAWETFYLRVNHNPTAATKIWTATNSQSSTRNLSLAITTSGTIQVIEGAATVKGTSSLSLTANGWYRIDICFKFGEAAADSRSGLAIVSIRGEGPSVDGTGAFTGPNAEYPIGGGAGLVLSTAAIGGDLITNSTLIATTDSTLDYDIDDWICRGLNPINFFSGNIIDGGFLENSPDWLYGSHVFQVRASGLRADTSVNWTGKYENLLNDFVVPGDTLTSFMSTATSASRLAITTDLLQAIPDQRLGVAAWCIAAYQNSANTSATAQLGSQATVAGVVETEALSTVTLINSGAGFVSTILMQGLPAGLTQPTPLDQLDLILNPGTIGGTIKMALLSVQVECLGYWGREDLPASVDTPRPNPQVHNSPYPKSQASLAVAPPPAPFVVYSGQYTGTGAGQEISFVQPVHWIFIRKVAASAPTRLWWSTRVSPMAIDSANGSLLEGVNVSGLSPTTMKLSGTDTVLNGNGLTYQYVAVSDTAMRFMCNAEMAGFSQSAGTAQNLCLLADPLFSIGAAFGGREAPDTGVNQQWYADSAMAALVASTITGNTTTNKFTCGVGSLNVDSSVQRTGVGSQFSCWRDTDQNGDSGSVDILTYTGDGTGARNIAVALGGRSPLLAFIFPETSGGCVYRDPGFTGTNSAGIAGTIITTGITGGDLNQITVASNLNTNAVVYHVFVIAGAINPGGWSGQVVDVATAPTEQAAPGPFIPDVVRGWYYSDEAFAGNVQVTTFNGRPRPPRDWDKLSAFSAKFGGSPGASVTFHNHIIYPGNDYVVSTDQPPIRLFDGVTDRLVGNIPNSGATISQAIVSMLLNAGIVYLTSFDSGTTSANFAGRVFTFNPLTTELAQLSTGFSAGEVPYAMVWHMGRLWVGTNKGDGSAGTIYYIRPGLDTAWTTDHVLAAGGAVSMVSYQGELYVGTDNTVGNFAHVYKRDSSGTWTTSLTATGGAAAVNNRFPSMLVDNGFIYASYFNADATNIAKIYQFNGTAWSTVYNGASGTLRPFILLFKAVKQVFAYGGSTTQAAALITTSDDGVTWLDLTAELVGAQRAPIPTVGLVQ